MAKKRGLGMGLGALIQGPDSVNITSNQSGSASSTRTSGAPGLADIFNPKSNGQDSSPKPGSLKHSNDASNKDSTTPKKGKSSDTSPTSSAKNPKTAQNNTQNDIANSGAKTTSKTKTPDQKEKPTVIMSDEVEVIKALVPTPGATFAALPIAAIDANRDQPRESFDPDELQELADSIKEFGVLQPIRVREVFENGLSTGNYELIAGERRLRASKLAGNTTVPAIIADVTDDNMLAEALIENLQRVNLNALEIAASYRQLMDDFSLTQEQLAKKIGKTRPAVANTLRLMKLPVNIQRRIASGVLSEGHARALIGIENTALQDQLASRIVSEGLSVRAIEEEVAMLSGDSKAGKIDGKQVRNNKSDNPGPAEVRIIQDELSEFLDTTVNVKHSKTKGKNKGQIVINYADIDDLKRIWNAIQD
jgi:ParB family chromosome partitioning protein